ncbi:MAG: hypothetical protein ACYC5F_11025 [Thermoleophilia bacterium]
MTQSHVIESFGDEKISPELPSMLSAVCDGFEQHPIQLSKLHTSLEALLAFLASPAGRTKANCRAADLFFTLDTGCGTSFDGLPEGYQLILDDIAGALHHTLTSPEIAANFFSTPEKLLARLRELPVPGAGT